MNYKEPVPQVWSMRACSADIKSEGHRVARCPTKFQSGILLDEQLVLRYAHVIASAAALTEEVFHART